MGRCDVYRAVVYGLVFLVKVLKFFVLGLFVVRRRVFYLRCFFFVVFGFCV